MSSKSPRGRVHWIGVGVVALGAVAALALTGAVAVALGRQSSPVGTEVLREVASRYAEATTPTTTVAPAPAPAPPPIRPLRQPLPVFLPVVPGGEVGPGAEGAEVQAFEQRLSDLAFDPGPVDGSYDQATAYAVQTLQKLMGTDPNGRLTEAERLALNGFRYPAPLQPDGEANRTEIDVTRQVLTLYSEGRPALVTTTSTGSGEYYCYTPRGATGRVCEYAVTPSGRYEYYREYAGWEKSPLGQLYNPVYFNRGIAVHGYSQVPTSPASHGCVRIPMHIADYYPGLVENGMIVYVFGGMDQEAAAAAA